MCRLDIIACDECRDVFPKKFLQPNTMTRGQVFLSIIFAVLCSVLSLAQDDLAQPVAPSIKLDPNIDPDAAFERAQKNFLRYKEEGIGFCLNDDTFLNADGKLPQTMVISFLYVKESDRGSNKSEEFLESVEHRNYRNGISGSNSRVKLGFFSNGNLEWYSETKGFPPGNYSFAVRHNENGKRRRFIDWYFTENKKYGTRTIDWDLDGKVLSDDKVGVGTDIEEFLKLLLRKQRNK